MQQGNKIILILGIIAIAAGILIIVEASSYQKKARFTEGKVVYVLGSSFRIQYFTEDGTEKIKQASQKNNRRHEGDSANVWYLIENPDKARLSDGTKGGKKVIIAGVFGILLGIYPLFIRKKDTSGTPVS